MKKDWTYKKLGEVATYVNGYAFKPETWSEKGLPIIRIQNLNNANAAFNYYEGELPEKYIVNKGDLLISWSASLGAYYWEGDIAYLNQHIFKVVFDKSDIIKGFLKYAVEAKLEDMKRKVHGATMQHIVKKDFDNTIIPIPPLSIQRSIVSELDLLHSVIEKKQEQLRALDNLAQSLFYQMFGDPITNPMGWEIKKLGEVGIFERGKGISKNDFVEDGAPCVHYGQLHTAFGAYTTKHLSCISESLIDNPRIAHTGDVLLALTSEDVEGSCKSTAWLGDYDIIVGSDAAVYHHTQDGMYISFYTRTEAFYKQKEKYAHGFKVTHISTKDIETFTIPLPPLSLQQSFAAKVSAIEAQKQAITQSIKDVESLLAQRMDHYFG